MESPEELEFRSIEDRLNLEAEQLDALIASGMWLFADQAAFPPAADNHGRVVHSHADGAIFFAHAGAWHQVANEVDLQTAMASLASEATTRETNDDALSARLDTLEADPTTATAVAAGDAATLSSANTYTDTKVADVIGTAPGVLDTLGEIADAINDDANVYTTLVTQISDEATARENADNALDARITTIEDAPYATDAGVTIVAQDLRTDFETDDATETAARTAADAALSSRIDTLEADPTTQAALDAEVTARTSGDSALDTRVTALEGNAAITDPTTATAVAAVQSDVDANQTASESADAALSGRLDVLEADPTTQTLLTAEETARISGDASTLSSAQGYTDTLRDDTFPADPCENTDLTAEISAGDQSTAQDGKFHYDQANKRIYIPNDIRKPDGVTNLWPYGLNNPPASNTIYINGIEHAVTDYSNTSGVTYVELVSDINYLLGKTLTLRWCEPQTHLPYVPPIELTWKAPVINPVFTGVLTCDGQINGGTIVIGNAGTFSTPALPDGVSFADLVEAIGDALVARPKLDGSNIPGTYNNDTEAAAGGVAVGGIYKNTNGTIHWRVS